MKLLQRLSMLCAAVVFTAFQLTNASAEQFVLFDGTFTFTEKDALETQSHLYVNGDEQWARTPKDWTAPVDYRNGTVRVRLEVLEKPAGDAPTTWSLCYIPNKGQKNNYGCIGSPKYVKTGVYEKDYKMTEFWENDSIIWSEGIKKMSLVIKDATKGGQGHAHKQPDPSKFLPTKVRFTMVQVSKGEKYDESLAKLEMEIWALSVQRHQLTDQFGKNHPKVKALDAQIETLTTKLK